MVDEKLIKPWFGLLHSKNWAYLSYLSPFDRGLTSEEIGMLPINFWEKPKEKQDEIESAYLDYLNSLSGKVYLKKPWYEGDKLEIFNIKTEIFHNFIVCEDCEMFYFQSEQLLMQVSDFCECLIYSVKPLSYDFKKGLNYLVHNEKVQWSEEFRDYIEMVSEEL